MRDIHGMNKSCVIVSKDTEKAFDNSTPSCDKNTQKTRNRRALPQPYKRHLLKPTADVQPTGGKPDMPPARSGTRQGCPHSPLPFNIVLCSQITWSSRYRVLRNPWKIVIANKFSCRAQVRCKKSIAFLYTCNKWSKMKLRKKIHLQKHKKNKTLRNKPNKRSAKRILWKLKTTLSELKEDLNKWENTRCSRIGRLPTVKVACVPNREQSRATLRIPADALSGPSNWFYHVYGTSRHRQGQCTLALRDSWASEEFLESVKVGVLF